MSVSEASIAVVIVAAGDGTRLGRPEPKAFVPLHGGTILSLAVHAALGMRETPHLVLVVPPDRAEAAAAMFTPVADAASAPFDVVPGGASRQDSVARGLAVLPHGIDTVLVHDAARALTPSVVFDEVAAAVRARGHGVIPALDVVDTVKRVGAGRRVVGTIDRTTLVAVQTPQGFPRSVLDAAYAEARDEHTDDAALVAAAGTPVDVVPGDARAFKITVPADLERAERMLDGPVGPASGLPSASPRIGTGVDVHAFSTDPTIPLRLAGLEWPGERGLAGHSDGDAASHAICDALLAAAGLGDVGRVFGTDDPRLAGAAGATLLTETRRLVEAAGFRIGNVSVQLVGNRPRLAPRRDEAERTLSEVLGAPVSVSATTSDALGFTGRGEGVAAIATALVLPDGLAGTPRYA